MIDEKRVKDLAYHLERACWFLVFFGMLTQIHIDAAYPSYNIAIGFWGVYCAFSRHGRATFGFIMFTLLAAILDIVFCSLNGTHESATHSFCLVIFILALFVKIYALFIGAHYFASIGGAQAMESSNLSNSQIYETLGSMEGSQNAGYYPPTGDSSLNRSSSSFDSGRGGDMRQSGGFEGV